MRVLVSYDISQQDSFGRKRLRKVAKLCVSHGQRVQFSVFECSLTPAQWVSLRSKLLAIIDPAQDSLRFYLLGTVHDGDIEHHGVRAVPDIDGPLII